MALRDQSSSAATVDARRVGLLAVGDLAVFMVFAAIGRASHSEAAGFSAIVEVAQTAAPFALGWFVVSPWLGAFNADVTAHPRRMLGRTALAWLLALPIGLIVRALIIGRGSPLSFAIVTFVTALLLLLGWRGVYTWLASRRV
ncbi:MAG TPA: DUF3054 domain-containing protein [Roseiflexaceae bacterium]|jgi:hypothetical protein|nr:DUF3054 domain-containing protein [Roseiflexaceae bacterium]